MKLLMEYLRFMPIPFLDLLYVLHNASNLSQPEVPRHLFQASPNGLYALITNDSPEFEFRIQWGKENECLIFKCILLPRDDADSTANGQQLALIRIVGCEHRDILQK
jgi:hypothetical protein